MGNQESASAGLHVEGSVSVSGAADAGVSVESQGQAHGPPSPKKRRLSFKGLRKGSSFRRSFRIRRSGRDKKAKSKKDDGIEMEGGVSAEIGAGADGNVKGSVTGKPGKSSNLTHTFHRIKTL